MLTTILLSIVALLDILSIGLIFPIAKLLTNDATYLARNEIKFLLSIFKGITPHELAGILSVAFVFVLILKGLISISILFWTNKMVILAEGRFMARLYRAYLKAPLEYHHSHNSSEFLRNINQSVVHLFRSTLLISAQTASGIGLSLCIFGILIYTDPLAAITCFMVLGGGGLIYSASVTRPTTKMAKDNHDLSVNYMKIMRESLECVSEVHIFGKINYFLSNFIKMRIVLAKIGYWQHTILNAPRYIMEILIGVLVASVVLILVVSGRSGDDVIAILALYGIASMRLMPIITGIIGAINSARTAIPSVIQLTKDVEYFGSSIVADTPWNFENKDYFEPKNTPGIQDEIEIRNVSHYYTDDGPVLENVSITIKKGQSIGLIGQSGSGKSTLANIILGLIKPTSGDVLMDGKPIDIEIPSILRSIGYVPQHVHLLDDTIRKNVAFGIPDDQIDDKRIKQAIEKSQLLDFTNSLPAGFDTSVGEAGVRLSGGQLQRIGIARVLYYNPDILVFDEATSALDVETEAIISEVLQVLQGEKTLIIIAHRLSTIKKCDNIICLKEGKVTAQGDFNQLKKSSHDFQSMIKLSSFAIDQLTPEIAIP